MLSAFYRYRQMKYDGELCAVLHVDSLDGLEATFVDWARDFYRMEVTDG